LPALLSTPDKSYLLPALLSTPGEGFNYGTFMVLVKSLFRPRKGFKNTYSGFLAAPINDFKEVVVGGRSRPYVP
jgi:hypothetical protein